MSVSKHVFENFLRPCKAVFGDPPTDDAEIFFAEFDRQMSGFSAEALAVAKDTVIRNHKGPARWPKVAICVDAAGDAQDDINAKHKSRERTALERYLMRYNRAEDRLHNETGRRAAREGWILGLKEFVAIHDQLPARSQATDIIETSRFVDRCAAGAVDLGYFKADLQVLAGNILRRREALASRIAGDPDLTSRSRAMSGDDTHD